MIGDAWRGSGTSDSLTGETFGVDAMLALMDEAEVDRPLSL